MMITKKYYIERRKTYMASSNHVNYWNYLENVTQNRNREYENTRHNTATEGIGLLTARSGASLNLTQELVNKAQAIKLGADTKVSEASAQKIAADRLVSLATVNKIKQDIVASVANIEYQRGTLLLQDRALVQDMEKFAQKYILDELDTSTRAGNLRLGVAKLEQELDIHVDKMNQADKDRFQKYISELNTYVNAQGRNTTEIAKALIGVIDFF